MRSRTGAGSDAPSPDQTDRSAPAARRRAADPTGFPRTSLPPSACRPAHRLAATAPGRGLSTSAAERRHIRRSIGSHRPVSLRTSSPIGQSSEKCLAPFGRIGGVHILPEPPPARVGLRQSEDAKIASHAFHEDIPNSRLPLLPGRVNSMVEPLSRQYFP